MIDPSACPDELELCALADGTLSGERAAVVRDHIGDCPACRVVVAELSSTQASPAPSTDARPPDAESSSARYELLRLVATGGMGEVFLARDHLLGRDVAIKLLHEDASSPGSLARSRRRILREAQALASFAHPNVVAAYDLGVLDGRAFLAMEYVRGRTLRQWIAEERPARAQIVDMLVQAGRGLLAAHEMGLVHRDFKPENVLVGQDGRARVTDFGLAHSTPSDERGKPVDVASESTATLDGELSGTPAYMAPEQLAGAPANDRSDQYAFCVTLHEALHGHRPGIATRTGPPDRLTRAIDRGLSRDPRERFASLGLLLAELEASSNAGHGEERRSRNVRVALAIAGAVAFLGLAVGGGSFLRARHASTLPVSLGGGPVEDASVPSFAGLTYGAPDEQGVDARPLLNLASFIESEKLPVYSLLVSKNGVVVFELYTSGLTREHAHYLMGVTASVTSALVGVAIDRRVIAGPETSVADALPPDLFPSPAARDRFREVTIRDVLGSSALDAPVPPHDLSEAAQERLSAFVASPNRTAFALRQEIVPHPGTSFQRTDLDALIATGILEYRMKKTALEFADETLFGPMEFRHHEWMHQDDTGIDNGAYGLRLRPIDMQKLGLLYLARGMWNGKRLVSSDWVLRSFSPWIRTTEGLAAPNYGWGWTTVDYGSVVPGQPWTAHLAQGWKGQRIAVFANQGVVVTMTGVIEPPEDESALFRRIVRDYVMPAVEGPGAKGARPEPDLRAPLASLLERIRTEPSPLRRPPEARMVPSIEPKERHHGFRPD